MASSNIDRRIVEMDFDNSRFERNVNESIGTLDKLKNALNMKGAEKGFNELERNINALDFSGLERSIYNIENRLSVFGIVGARVIQTITDKALGALEKINNAVYGQMKSGGISRALNLEHANFMLEGILKNADLVSKIMGSDGPVQKSVKGTAYGLDAAANAASQFVASGIKDTKQLETALTAISGAAAISGSSYEDIARIFTKVAASGRMMGDTVVELSTRGINALATLSEQLDIPVEKLQEMQKKSQISFEMFSEAMNKAFGEQAKKANETFTGALSNVKAALSRIGAKVAAPTIENLRVIFVQLIGVIDATSKTLQPFIDVINNVIYKVSYAFATFLGDADDVQRVIANIADTFVAAFQVLYSVILPIKRAFEDLFPAATVSDAVKLTELIRDFTRSLILNAEAMVTVRRIFRGVFAVFDILGQVISALIRVIFPATNGLKDFFAGFANGAATLGDYIYAISLVLKESDLLYKVFSNLKIIVGGALIFIGDKVSWLINLFKSLSGKVKMPNFDGLKDATKTFQEAEGPLTKVGNFFSVIFGGIGATLKSISPILGAFAGVCGNALTTIGHAIETVLTGGGFKTLLALVNSAFLVTIGLDIAAFIHHIIGSMSKGIKLIDGIRGLFATVNTHIKVMTASIKADILVKIAKAIAILAASLFILAAIPADGLARAVIALGLVGAGLLGFMYVIDKMASNVQTYKETLGMFVNSAMLTGIAASILILAGAMKVVSSIDSDRLMDSLGVITALLGELVIVALVLNVTEAKIKTGALALIEMSVAVRILASAMEQIGNLSWEQIAKGLVGVTVALGELTAVAIAMKGSGFGVGTGTGMLLMAAALKVVAGAIGEIGSLPVESLSHGLVTLGAALAELAVFMTVMGEQSGLFGVAVSMDLMALAIMGIANALSTLGGMGPVELTAAIVAMGIALAEMGITLSVLGQNALQCIGAAAAIGILAISLNALIPILTLFSTMDFAQLGVTLLGFAGALTIMGVAAAVFGAAAGLLAVGAGVIALVGAACLVSAAGMAASAVAIGLLVSAFEALTTLSWLDLLSGLGKLVVVFTAIGVAAIALGPAVTTMLGLSAALLGIGAAAMILAASVSVAAIGTSLMADALKKFEDISWDAVCKGLMTLLGALLALGVAALVLSPLSPIILTIGAGVAMLGVGALAAAAALLIFSQAISVLIPLIQEIAPAIGQFAADAWNFICQLIAQIWDGLVDLWAKVQKFLMEAIGGLLMIITDIGGLILHGLVELGGAMVKALGVPDDWVKVAKDFMHGLVTGLTNGIKDVIHTVVELGKSMIDSIRDAIDSHSDSKETIAVGEDFDGGLITGIGNLKDKVIDKVAEVGKGMIDQAKSDANKVTEVWEATVKYYGRNLEFDVGLKNGTIKNIAGVGYVNTKTNEIKDLVHETKSAIDSIEQERVATGGNTSATKSNSKAKAENKKANEKKTKSIDEESEALGEETEAADENEEAIRELAEQIFVVTEAYHHLRDYLYTTKDKFKIGAKSVKALGNAFSSVFGKEALKATNGVVKSGAEISKVFKEAGKTIPKTTDKIKKGLYAFTGEEYDKKMTKRLKKVSKSVKSITKQVEKTGKTIAKVSEGSAKMFYKNGNKVETQVIRLTKNVKNLAKYLKKAQSFAASFNGLNGARFAEEAQNFEDFQEKLRGLEKYYKKFSDMTQPQQGFVKAIVDKFKVEFERPMQLLTKQMEKVTNWGKGKSTSMVYIADAFLSLASTLYDGSEAANDYYTQIARLEFLFKEGVIEYEELEEAKQGYIQRSIEALKEYYTTLQETLVGQFNIFEEFDQKLDDQQKDLIGNIESQIAGFNNLGQMLMELSKRNLDFNLLKQLTDQGADAYGIIKNLLSMTNNELALFQLRYQQSSITVQETTDMMLAALANARVMATSKKAEREGKQQTAKMIKESTKAARQIADNNKAVARNQAIYNKLTKKEVKEYLKTLDKQQQKEYKAAYKAEKKRQKQLKAAAAVETANRKEKERLQTIKDSITSLTEYIAVLNQYATDFTTISSIMEDVNKAFEPLNDVIKELGEENIDQATKALMAFGETLEATGEDGLSYFEEMSKRVQNYVDNLKEAIHSQFDLTNEIKKSENGLTSKKILSNVITNLQTISSVQPAIDKLISSYGISAVGNIIGDLGTRLSNKEFATVLEMLESYSNMTKSEIEAVNASLSASEKLSTQIANNITSVLAGKEYNNTAKAEVDRLTQALAALNEEYATQQQWSSEIVEPNYQAVRGRYQEMLNNQKSISSNIAYYKALKKSSGLTKKQAAKLEALEQEYAQLQGTVTKYYNNDYLPWEQEHLKVQQQLMDTKASIDATTKSIAEYQAQADKYHANWTHNQALQEEQLALQTAAQNIMTGINSYDKLITKIRKAEGHYIAATGNAVADTKINAGITKVLEKVSGAVDKYKNKWKEFYITYTGVLEKVSSGGHFKVQRGTIKNFTNDIYDLTQAFIKLGDSLESSSELTGDYFDDLATKLGEYRDTLYDTIKGQVSLFDEFKKYSGDKATDANTYLSNMNSQIKGMQEWMNNMQTLADRGVTSDILKMFAAEGLNSFEKVEAFANATDAQLGELITQYKNYLKMTEDVTDGVLAAVAHTYSDTVTDLTNNLVTSFNGIASEKVQEIGENTSEMLVTGIKNGLTNAMPAITEAITSTDSTTQIATKVGNAVGAAINQGVVQSVANSVEDVVNSVIEKFKMAVDSINSYVEETLNDAFNITIHVNASEIDMAVARMNSAIYGINADAMTTGQSVTSSISNRDAAAATVVSGTAPTQEVSVTYTQNNYSPKALSRTEIYRQTKNQLSTIESVVAATGG